MRLCAARHGAEDAVHKGNDLRVLIFPRQLHALVDGNAVRHIVDIAHFINGKPHRRLRQAGDPVQIPAHGILGDQGVQLLCVLADTRHAGADIVHLLFAGALCIDVVLRRKAAVIAAVHAGLDGLGRFFAGIVDLINEMHGDLSGV